MFKETVTLKFLDSHPREGIKPNNAFTQNAPIWVNAPTLPPCHTFTSDNRGYVNCAWERDGLGVVAGLLLLLSGLVGWQLRHPPDLGYVRAVGALDATLVQQWGSLPKAVQEQLSVTYGRLGLTPPGQRK